jgi:CarD family transcriptional regulator
MYQVGNKVVYPNHGIGLIQSVSEFEVAGEKVRFFNVLILSSNSTVKVPAKNADAVGLRELIDKNVVKEVYTYLGGPELARYDDWKERFKVNSDLMRTGKMLDMVVVLKSLYFVSLDKPLSFREKRMYDRAISLIAMELAEVRKVAPQEIEKKLLKTLAEAKDNIKK